MIDKRDIQYVGDNIYNLYGHEFEVSPMIAASIDRFIGLKSKQVKAVADVSGDEGVVDYRNYIAMVNSIVEPEKLALVADPRERKIVSAVPLKKNAIPMEGFFDFAETAEMVIPYQSDVNAYNAAGFSQYDPSQAKGSIGVWELFNRLTFFASHNEIWADDDNRRIALMSASVAFLRRP